MGWGKRVGIVAGVLVAMVAGSLIYDHVRPDSARFCIYGSVDVRTVRLAFEEPGRIEAVLVQEGQSVQAGEPLARLETTRYRIAQEQAAAQVSVAQRQLELLQAGARTQTVQAARAQYVAAETVAQFAQRTCDREKRLGAASAQLRLDETCTQARIKASERDAARERFAELSAGTRSEEIALAQAQLVAAQVAQKEAERALAACLLQAPSSSVVRARLKEKGDMVQSGSAVFELALMQPVRVRAWIDEVHLSRVRMGQKARVRVDAYPNQEFMAQVGFVSTVAEFTPKTVQTQDVRTALVYEVLLTVADPQGLLRLGMPATVELDEAQGA